LSRPSVLLSVPTNTPLFVWGQRRHFGERTRGPRRKAGSPFRSNPQQSRRKFLAEGRRWSVRETTLDNAQQEGRGVVAYPGHFRIYPGAVKPQRSMYFSETS
jgi:hypothetical protein